MEDLWDTCHADAATEVSQKFEKARQSTVSPQMPHGTVWKTVLAAFWWPFVAAGLIEVLRDCVMFIGMWSSKTAGARSLPIQQCL